MCTSTEHHSLSTAKRRDLIPAEMNGRYKPQNQSILPPTTFDPTAANNLIRLMAPQSLHSLLIANNFVVSCPVLFPFPDLSIKRSFLLHFLSSPIFQTQFLLRPIQVF
ncbi:hypothetical protein AAC387_Pa01g1462 [Persea americana]